MSAEKALVRGIVTTHSAAFVESVFESYRQGHLAVMLRGANDSRRIEQVGVTEVVEPPPRFGWMVFDADTRAALRSDDGEAHVSFTSGTEGEPKGVVLTHRALHDVTQRLNDVMAVDDSIREYVGVPVNYSFGLGRCRAVAAAGGRAFIPEHGFNPVEIRDMLARGEINAISAVPSLWRVLLKGRSLFGDEAMRVRWIEIGSQAMSRGEKEELKALFPQARIVQHYGLTEASRSTFLRVDETSGEALDSVGRAYGATELALSDEGCIRIRGPHVASALLNGHGVMPASDAEGWFQTKDLGRLEGGYLYYLGRADDLINCGGIKLSPDALEDALRRELGIKTGIAVAPVDDAATGHAILIAHTPEAGVDEAKLKDAAVRIVADHGLRNRNALRLLALDEFPRTDTGKVRRRELAALHASAAAGAQVAAVPVAAPSPSAAGAEEEIARVWREVLGTTGIDPEKNFYDLGGDSLTALVAVMEMERRAVPPAIAKGMLQGRSIREIATLMAAPAPAREPAHVVGSAELRSGMAINVLRGFLVLCVVFAHWSGGLIERLPAGVQAITPWLAPLLAIGTPGFAIVYGVSAGHSMWPIYLADPARFHRIRHKTLALLSAGIVLLAAVVFLQTWLLADAVTFTDFTNSFYSVLSYYWLITASLGLWFWWLRRSPHRIASCLFAAAACYGVHYYLIGPLGVHPAEGVVEFVKLLFTAKYAYFNMLSGTLIGIAIGMWLRDALKAQRPLGALAPIGGACVLAAIVMASHAGESADWWIWPVPTNAIWRWVFYTGFVLLALVGLRRVLEHYNGYGSARKYAFQLLAVFGILAFPLFVTHQLVIPLKDILVQLTGLPQAPLLAFSMGLFLLSGWAMYRKVHAMNFRA